MKKLLKYKSGAVHVIGDVTGNYIYPDSQADEEYDLRDLTKDEFLELKRNPKSNNFKNKMERIK